MTITGQAQTSLLDSVLTADTTRADMGVAVLKKAQDSEKSQGAAMVNMLEKAGSAIQGQRLDAYA